MTLPHIRCWSSTHSNSHIRISQTGYSATCPEPSYFNSAIGEFPLGKGGVWEIALEVKRRGTTGLLQVGVSQRQNLEDGYFSATAKGWGFYPCWNGFKEHEGVKKEYGCKLMGSGVVTICVDMRSGTISFRVNQQDCGVAYTLTKHELKAPLYPAFATCDRHTVCSFVVKYWKERLPFLQLLGCKCSVERLPVSLAREICYLIA